MGSGMGNNRSNDFRKMGGGGGVSSGIGGPKLKQFKKFNQTKKEDIKYYNKE